MEKLSVIIHIIVARLGLVVVLPQLLVNAGLVQQGVQQINLFLGCGKIWNWLRLSTFCQRNLSNSSRSTGVSVGRMKSYQELW